MRSHAYSCSGSRYFYTLTHRLQDMWSTNGGALFERSAPSDTKRRSIITEKASRRRLFSEPGYLQKQVVPKAGLEPARPLRRGILNPLRLPFRHLGSVRVVYPRRRPSSSLKLQIFENFQTLHTLHDFRLSDLPRRQRHTSPVRAPYGR